VLTQARLICQAKLSALICFIVVSAFFFSFALVAVYYKGKRVGTGEGQRYSSKCHLLLYLTEADLGRGAGDASHPKGMQSIYIRLHFHDRSHTFLSYFVYTC